jgi:hypothetical protein
MCTSVPGPSNMDVIASQDRPLPLTVSSATPSAAPSDTPHLPTLAEVQAEIDLLEAMERLAVLRARVGRAPATLQPTDLQPTTQGENNSQK